MVKDQWEKIDVTVDLQGFEAAVWSAHARERTYSGSIRQGHCGGCPMTALPRFTTGHTRNYTDWSDPHYDEIVEPLVKELDPDKRNELIKEASVYLLNEAIAIPQAVKVQGRFSTVRHSESRNTTRNSFNPKCPAKTQPLSSSDRIAVVVGRLEMLASRADPGLDARAPAASVRILHRRAVRLLLRGAIRVLRSVRASHRQLNGCGHS